jgi:hypothetical protein
LASPLYVAIVFGAFTCLFPISCTCYSSCFYSSFGISLSVTCFSCFLRLLVTTFDF